MNTHQKAEAVTRYYCDTKQNNAGLQLFQQS